MADFNLDHTGLEIKRIWVSDEEPTDENYIYIRPAWSVKLSSTSVASGIALSQLDSGVISIPYTIGRSVYREEYRVQEAETENDIPSDSTFKAEVIKPDGTVVS